MLCHNFNRISSRFFFSIISEGFTLLKLLFNFKSILFSKCCERKGAILINYLAYFKMALHKYSARSSLCFLVTSLWEVLTLSRLSRCSLVNGFIGHQFLCKPVLIISYSQKCFFFKTRKNWINEMNKIFIFPLISLMYRFIYSMYFVFWIFLV